MKNMARVGSNLSVMGAYNQADYAGAKNSDPSHLFRKKIDT